MSTSSTRLSTPLSTSHNTPKPSSSSTPTTTHHHKSHQTPPQHGQNNAAYNLLSKAHPSSPETANKIFTEKIAHKPLLLSTTTTVTSADHQHQHQQHGTNSRSARRHIRLRKKGYALRHARPKPLSAKEKCALHLYDLQPAECRYEIYKGLNRLWRRYILEVLGYVDRDGRVVAGRIGQPVIAVGNAGMIASADFHGMEVEVVACADPGRVGCKGIVVRETRSTLVVVCDERESKRKREGDSHASLDLKKNSKPANDAGTVQQDKVRMILKRGAVFRVTVDLPTKEEMQDQVEYRALGQQTCQPNQLQQSNVKTDNGAQSAMDIATRTTTIAPTIPIPKRQLVFELHGDQLEIRPVERAVKKFKWKPTDYL